MEYRIRLLDLDGKAHVIDVSFSQLCEYLPPRHRNETQRLQEKKFWNGEGSIDGPRGNVKLVSVYR